MAVTTTQFAVIRGVYYDGGRADQNSFVCNATQQGRTDSEGMEDYSEMLIKGNTYYFRLKAEGDAVQYPYAVSVDGPDSDITGWYTEDVFPYGTHTVTFDANGGTNAPGAQTKVYGTILKLSTQKPSRDGYTFQGWGTSNTTATVSYTPGADYTADEDVTLYAVWKINTYTVSYDANGGTGAPSNQTKTHNVALVLSKTKPTKTGHTFKGWGTSSTTTTVSYASGASYTDNAAIKLYAVWEVNKLVVNYYSNYATWAFSGAQNTVGSTKNVLVLTQRFAYNSKYLAGLADYSSSAGAAYMTREGYNPTKYWGTSTTGGTLVSESKSFNTGQELAQEFGMSLASENKSIDLYPQWQIKTYTISYDKNTEDAVTNIPDTQTKTHFEDLALSSNVPVRKQYSFLGWSRSPTGGVIYSPGDLYATEEDVTLYAVWELSASRITLYDENGEPHTGICYFYDASGERHYAILTIYDSDGNPHSVV